MSPQRNQPKSAGDFDGEGVDGEGVDGEGVDDDGDDDGGVGDNDDEDIWLNRSIRFNTFVDIFIQQQPNTTKPNMDTNTKPNTTKPDMSNMSTKSTRTKVEFIGRPLKQLECVKKQSTFQADLSRNHFIPSP